MVYPADNLYEGERRFIVVDPKTLTLTVRRRRPTSNTYFEVSSIALDGRELSPFEELVKDYVDRDSTPGIEVQRAREEWERKHPDAGAGGNGWLYPVLPWLTSLAHIMWEGIIQGLTWELVRPRVMQALSVMRAEGVAPEARRKRDRRKLTSWEFGVNLRRFAEDGMLLQEMFFGLRRRSMKMTRSERSSLVRRKHLDGTDRAIRRRQTNRDLGRRSGVRRSRRAR